ncbi:collagen binding domain-containing protein [Paenibacillus sp. FSL H7-0357]|uniref:LPXTG cell wall anchor domain-containing protein n=1 Tax=Paenibacillus sp. FSL H7-0357 TaxID=1536774 RepID=UPI00068F52F8|nr:LPXTG cell wall anchor domain-containing protein [Paenibacillus sp. FSL H7-0357]
MLKKKFSLSIMIIMLFVQYAYGIGFTSQATAAGIETERDLITSVSMAVYGPDGQTVTDSVYDVNSTVSLDYTWSLPNGHGYVAGDTFTFLLPEQFQLFNDIGGALVSDDGEVGSFTVSQSTHQVVMTFNSYIESHDNVQGTLRVNTKFDKQKIPGSGVEEILFPVNGGTQKVIVHFKPEIGSTIDKHGSSSGYNATSIQWTVDVNKKLEHVANATVTDPIPAGLSLDSTATLAVYELAVQLDGTVSPGALLDSRKYSAEILDSKLILHFTDPVISRAYRIAYTTPIAVENKRIFTNTATFTGDGRDPVSSSATVTVERGGTLKKFSTGYEWGNQVISWAIEYNYNGKNIPQANAVLSDLFDASHELVAGSVKVYPVTLDSAAVATKGPALIENVDFTVSPITATGKKGFKLQFTNDVSAPHRIEYKIKAKDRVIKETTVINSVTDSTYTYDAKQLVRPAVIYKTLSGVDYKNKTTDWKITLNGDNYPMSHVVVKDSFPDGGQKFVPGSLLVRDENWLVVSPSKYTVTYDSPVQPNAGFTVKFHSPISGFHTINYTTLFSNDWLTGSTDDFINKAQIDWMDSAENIQSTVAFGKFIPRPEEKSNGFKSGVYNAAAKEITWTVGANYNGKAITDPVVTDVLTAGQTLVPGSLKVYSMNIDTKGDFTKGSELSTSAYTYAVSSSNELKVEFAGNIGEPYIIEFKTTLEGQLIDATVVNTAKLLDGTKQVSKDLTASLKIPHGGEYIYKDGLQSGDKVDWSIAVNRTQSFVKNAKIIDEPSSNQILLQDSFHLYPTVVSVNGEVTKGGPELVKDVDYSLNINQNASGKQSFELSFLKDIKTAYVLEYKSLIVANTGDKLLNTVKFNGNNVVLVEKDTSKEVIVGVSSGSGTGSGVRGALIVNKLDAVNKEKPLEGATFELYRLNGTERVLINTLTTDTAGKAAFNNIWLGSYVLIETAAPKGYVLDSKEYPVTIGSSVSVGLTVYNTEEVPVPTPTPTTVPTTVPTTEPTTGPTTEPTTGPTTEPTPVPTVAPGGSPTPVPTTETTPSPTPTPIQTVAPGGSPTPVVIIEEPQIPAGPGATAQVTPAPSATPSPTPGQVTTTDDDIPLGEVEVEDDEIPAGTVTGSGGQLPQTGENSPLPIYLAGLGLILAGFILSRVFRRRKQE